MIKSTDGTINNKVFGFHGPDSLALDGRLMSAVMQVTEPNGMPMNSVLVVDDEAGVLDLTSHFLRGKGFTVACAANGAEALLQAAASAPEVVLLDISMPGMDGIAVLRELKKKYPATEVIMITAHNEVAIAITCMQGGAFGYLVKPLDFNHLHLEVNRALEHRRITLVLEDVHNNLELKVEGLQGLNEQKYTFLGMAAHDLRNPLVTIRGFSELLLEGGLSGADSKEFLQIINTNSNDMFDLLNNLLDISQIESGKFDLRLETVDISELVEKRAALQQLIAAKKNIAIEIHAEKGIVCLMDKERIAQAVDNLVSNAIKFSPEKTTVRVETAKDGGMAKVTVRDEGPGIKEDERHKLFGEFQKLSARPTGGEKSSGLGLAIAKKIVDAHKGEIGVESTGGNGSAFYFKIPEKMPEQKAKIRVLIADDEAHIRKLMSGMLTSMGCQVVAEAENGDIAVELYRQHKPHITLLDINMPKADGVSALKRIKAESPDALIIMITSLSSMDVVKECLALGAANYIRKDTPIAEMKACIKETWTGYLKDKKGAKNDPEV